MRDFVILTASCCDLPEEMARELGLEVVPLTVTLDGTESHNYLDGGQLGFHEFY